MKNKTKRYCSKIPCFALAALMIALIAYVFAPAEASAASRAFKSAGRSAVVIKDKQDAKTTRQKTWIRYKAPDNGCLKITAQNASDRYAKSYVKGDWQLFGKNRKDAVSPKKNYTTKSKDSFYYTDVYGVKKGTVYYLAVNANGGVKITASFTKITDKSGAKKSRALKLAKGKTATGLIRAGDGSVSDWYQFTLTAPQKLKLYLTPYTNNDISISISGPKGALKPSMTKVGISTSTGKKLNYGRKCPFTTKQAVKAGTYYIQIKPAAKTSSGYYKLVWK